MLVDNFDGGAFAVGFDDLDAMRASLELEGSGTARSELVYGHPRNRCRCEIADDDCLGGIVSCWHVAIVVGDAPQRPIDSVTIGASPAMLQRTGR